MRQQGLVVRRLCPHIKRNYVLPFSDNHPSRGPGQLQCFRPPSRRLTSILMLSDGKIVGRKEPLGLFAADSALTMV